MKHLKTQKQLNEASENLNKIYNMELVNQNNLVKIELKRLYDMLGDKLNHMEKNNVPRPDIRRVNNQYYQVQHKIITIKIGQEEAHQRYIKSLK